MIFLFYHLVGNCGCVNKIDGFSVPIDLSSLDLSPNKYPSKYIEYYKENKRWYLKKSSTSSTSVPLNKDDLRISLLDTLEDKFGITSIGVRSNNSIIKFYDWVIFLMRNSKHKQKLTFKDFTNDKYSLTMYTDGYHYLEYNSKAPKIVTVYY